MDVSNKLFGFYRAKVVDNKDPQKFGRVVVWVPQIMPTVPDTSGLWARPGNNPVGGRNSSGNGEHHYMGSSYIPKIGSWVFVFFESGNPDNPYYFGSCDLENTKVLPENQVGSNYEDKWTILKSHAGRTIIVSDDPDDERVEITGKKRLMSGPPTGNQASIYKVDTNQTVILLDERSGIEKILVRTRKGDYIHVDINERNLQCYFENDIRIECGKELSIKAGTNIRMKAGESIFEEAGQSVNRYAGINILDKAGNHHTTQGGSLITRDAPIISDNNGESLSAELANPVRPEGERVDNQTSEEIEAAVANDKAEIEYNAAVSKATDEAYSDIQKYKETGEIPPEYILACELGETSERYESGGKGPATVSSGSGDYGGVSYGTYQFASKGGSNSSCAKFVNQCSASSDFSGLTPGSPEFSTKWKEVCARDPEAFGAEQHDYIQSQYYAPAMARVSTLGVDESKICFGVRELIWSTSVQFGPTGCYNIFQRAGVNAGDSDQDIIDKVYKEKSKVQSYFKSSSSGVQNSVLKRFCTERLQNSSSCEDAQCNEVTEKIDNATKDDLGKIKSTDQDMTPKDGYEDFVI